jgi:hypothetical protein
MLSAHLLVPRIYCRARTLLFRLGIGHSANAADCPRSLSATGRASDPGSPWSPATPSDGRSHRALASIHGRGPIGLDSAQPLVLRRSAPQRSKSRTDRSPHISGRRSRYACCPGPCEGTAGETGRSGHCLGAVLWKRSFPERGAAFKRSRRGLRKNGCCTGGVATPRIDLAPQRSLTSLSSHLHRGPEPTVRTKDAGPGQAHQRTTGDAFLARRRCKADYRPAFH